MKNYPDILYVQNSILGLKVLGYRYNHRTAHHIHTSQTDSIISRKHQMIEFLQSKNVPIDNYGTLYNTRHTDMSKMVRTKRGYVLHLNIIETEHIVTARYHLDNNVLVLDTTQLENDEARNKSTSHPQAWQFFDPMGELTTDNVYDIVGRDFPDAVIGKAITNRHYTIILKINLPFVLIEE